MLESDPTRVVKRLGSDWIRLEADRMVVRSPQDMLDWSARAFRKTAILHEGRRWMVAEKSPGHRGSVRFELVPWPEGDGDSPGRVIAYDAAFVAERDAALRQSERSERLGPALLLIGPLVGLLPSAVKRSLEERELCCAVQATAHSLAVQGLVFLLAGTFAGLALIAGIAGAAPFPAWPALLLAAATGLDGLLRWSALHEDPARTLGFGEWLLPPWRRPSTAGVEAPPAPPLPGAEPEAPGAGGDRPPGPPPGQS